MVWEERGVLGAYGGVGEFISELTSQKYYSPALFKTNNSSPSVILKLVAFPACPMPAM